MEPDEHYRKYATDTQWEAYVAYCEAGGSKRAAAVKLGRSRQNLSTSLELLFRKAAQQGYGPPDITREVPEGLTIAGTSIRYGKDGQIDQYWNKTKPQGRDPEDVVKLADPKKITKVATLFNQSGQVTQQWVSEKPEEAQREALWDIFGKEIAAKVERTLVIPRSKKPLDSDLLAVYPVGDHHHGLLAWAEETGGASYDLRISEELLRRASTHLIGTMPRCNHALIAFLGDLLHYDSFKPITPEHGNLLDADSRFPKMVRSGVRMMRHMITAALEHHNNVHVIVEIGNHDLSSSVFLMELLSAVYENEPRVTVDTGPSHYHYYTYGKVLLGTHHGHGAKADRLPGIMAADRPVEWGNSAHRMWMTGHVHHRSAIDFAGCTVESFRVLPPADAYAHNKGYRSVRDMKSILFHREHGEISRSTCNPGILGMGAS